MKDNFTIIFVISVLFFMVFIIFPIICKISDRIIKICKINEFLAIFNIEILPSYPEPQKSLMEAARTRNAAETESGLKETQEVWRENEGE